MKWLMSRFLETICIKDGRPLHLDWHQRRVDATLKHFFPSASFEDMSLSLSAILASCDLPANGIYRCRVLYDLNAVSVEFFPYTTRSIKTLRLIQAPTGYDYRYKYADRNVLDDLFSQRGDSDDILITREGLITDTSVANIAFRKGDRWFVPSFPLLAGTTWKRLISSGQLIPKPIHQTDIPHFDAFKIFNSMNDWDGVERPTSFIKI
jgi:4-amino-4-deoxychorismate lyase